jgi:hypothetical protein
LGGDGEEEAVAEAPVLAVEHLLCEDYFCRVSSAGSNIGYNKDDGLQSKTLDMETRYRRK